MIKNLGRKAVNSLPRSLYELIWREYGKHLLGKVSRETVDPGVLARKSEFEKEVLFAESSPFSEDFEACHSLVSQAVGSGGLAGAISPGERKAIYLLVRSLRPGRVLEVGTHVAMSTYYMAMALRENGGGTITTVDILDVNADDGPWRQAGLAQKPAHALDALGVGGNVSFMAMPAARFLADCTGKFNLIFLDGDHSAPAVYGEIAAGLRLLNPGGLILLHDFFPGGKRLFHGFDTLTGPYLAVDRLIRENPGLAIVPLSPLPWTTLPGTSNTSLAMLLRD